MSRDEGLKSFEKILNYLSTLNMLLKKCVGSESNPNVAKISTGILNITEMYISTFKQIMGHLEKLGVDADFGAHGGSEQIKFDNCDWEKFLEIIKNLRDVCLKAGETEIFLNTPILRVYHSQCVKVIKNVLDLADKVNQTAQGKKNEIYQCPICGYMALDERPIRCPICNESGRNFVEI